MLGNVPRGQVGDEMARLQDLVKGLMFGDKDSAVREAATASLLKLSRTPELQQAVDGPNQMVAETPLLLVDTQGRPVAGAVVSTFFTRDLDRESSFTPSEELSLKPQTSDERGEATLTLSLWHPKAAKAVYAIRPDKERPLVGMHKVTGEELGKPNTIVMHPACRVRLRVECPAFRELEKQYHADLEGPGWERGAFLLMGDQTTDPFPLRAGSTTGELEFLVPPGRYTIIAFGTDTERVVLRPVEIQPGHRVRSLGVALANPSRLVQQGVFRNFWRLGRPDVDDRPNGDADESGVRYRRAISGPAPRSDAPGVQDLAFSPDGKTLATAHDYNDRPGEVKLWDIPTGSLVATWNAPDTKEGLRRLAFSPDGRILAGVVGSMHNFELESFVVLWDVDGSGIPKILRGHKASVTSIAFSPDGKTLASGGGDRAVRFWDVATGREIEGFKVGKRSEWPQAIAYARDGKTLAVAGGEDLKVWSVPDIRLQATLEPDGFWDQSLAFSPDGRTLAAAGATVGPNQVQEARVRLYDMIQKPPGRRAELAIDPLKKGVQAPFGDVAFTPDGRRVIAITSTTIAIWDAATGVELATLVRNSGNAGDRIDVSPDGQWLAVMEVQKARLIAIPPPLRGR